MRNIDTCELFVLNLEFQFTKSSGRKQREVTALEDWSTKLKKWEDMMSANFVLFHDKKKNKE